MKLKLVSLLLILSLALSLSGCFLQLSFPSEEPEVEEPEIPEEPVDTELSPSGPITPTEDGYTFETFVEEEVIGKGGGRDRAVGRHGSTSLGVKNNIPYYYSTLWAEMQRGRTKKTRKNPEKCLEFFSKTY